MRLIRRGALWLGGAIALYFLAAVAGAIIPGPRAQVPDSGGPATEILLVRGPIHYDFLLPLDETTRRQFADLQGSGLALERPDARWLVIGWGAREFYTTTGSYSEVKAGAVLKGIVGDRSVMRVDLVGKLRAGVETRRLRLSAPQYRALLAAISAEFTRDDRARPVALSIAGFTATDRFYAANGKFDLLRTCNVWVGRMLRLGGLRFGGWTPTPYAVTLSRWLYQTP